MTPEELLKPRRKQIADYPGNDNKIETVFTYDNVEGNRGYMTEKEWSDCFDKYPAIFKPLQWWEERKESDMPQYVKGLKSVRKVLQIEDHGSWAPSILVEGETIWSPIWMFQPATEQEYITQKQPQ